MRIVWMNQRHQDRLRISVSHATRVQYITRTRDYLHKISLARYITYTRYHSHKRSLGQDITWTRDHLHKISLGQYFHIWKYIYPFLQHLSACGGSWLQHLLCRLWLESIGGGEYELNRVACTANMLHLLR